MIFDTGEYGFRLGENEFGRRAPREIHGDKRFEMVRLRKIEFCRRRNTEIHETPAHNNI